MIRYEISTHIVEIAPAQTAAVDLTIFNESQLIDYFALSIEPVENADSYGLDPNWVIFNPNSFSLRPAQPGRSSPDSDSQQQVQIIINLPPAVIAGNFTGRINILARTGADNSVTIPFNLVVSELESQTLELQPVEQSSRRGTEIFRVLLANQGNSPHLYPVYAEDSDNLCRFELRPAEVMLQPGERANLTLKVKPRRRNWASHEQNYGFTVKLEGFAQETPGRFIQKCALPPLYWLRRHWVFVTTAFALLLALLIVAAVLLMPQLTPQVAAVCGPTTTRQFNVLSNDTSTTIYVSGRDGTGPRTAVVTEKADILPGLFASLVSVSPDGRRLAYVTARDEALNDARIWMIDLETKQRTQLGAVPAGLWPTAPVWSADGERLVYVQRPAGAAATATTQAVAASPATASATTPAPLTPATGDVTSQLQLFLSDVSKQPPEPAKVLEGAKLQPDLFYGDKATPVCWSSTNDRVLIRPKPSKDGDVPAQTEVNLDGTVKQMAQPTSLASRLNLNKTVPNLNPNPNLSNIRLPGGAGSVTNQAAACALNNAFSQNDPRWSDRRLKASDTATLSNFGCPVVAAAMVLNSFGVDINPSDLISTCVGDLSSPLYQDGWFLMLQRCSNNKLSGVVRGSFTWDGLDKALAKGPALVGLLGGQTGTHFVVVTGGANAVASSYRVADPFDGSTYKTLDYFLSAGYRLRWLVTYDTQESQPCSSANGSTPQSALSVDVRGLVDGQLYQNPPSFQYEFSGNAPFITATARFTNPTGQPDQLSQQFLPTGQPVSFAQEGLYALNFDAKNTDGVDLLNRDFHFVIDHTPPIITHTILTAPTKDGTFSGPVSIQLRANDPLTGIASLEYQLDGAANWSLYNSDTTSAPFTISAPGSHTVSYRAEDGAGNRTDPFTFNFVIQPPVTVKPTVAPGAATPTAKPAVTTPPVLNPAANGNQVVQPKPPAVVVPTPTPIPPTPRPTSTPVPTGTPVPTFTALPTNTLVPTGTPVPTPTLQPTPTIKPNPILLVSTAQLVYDINTNTLTMQISNKGTGSFDWTVQPDQSTAALLSFSAASGTLGSGATTSLTISLKALNLTGQVQNGSFQIVPSTGNPATVGVIILPQILPTAVFSAPLPSGPLDVITTSVSISVTAPGLAKPDHAVISATYQLATPRVVTLNPQLTSATNWAFNWDTSLVPPQTGVTLSGVLCMDPAETICKSIPALSGLQFALSASFTSPTSNQKLIDSLPVIVAASGRANHVSMNYKFTSNNQPAVPLADKPSPANNWNTLTLINVITPTTSTQTNLFQLNGLVCSSPDDSVCQPINPPVINLSTNMTATITFSQDLTTNPVLPANLQINIANPSSNIDHVSLYAGYKDTFDGIVSLPQWISTQVARRSPSGALAPSITWNTDGLPPQKNLVTLQVKACFTADESICSDLVSMNNLTIDFARPFSINTGSAANQMQSALIGSAFSALQVEVRDANGYKVANAAVNYTVNPASNGSGGTFTSGATAQVLTNQSGIASAPLTANGTPGGPFTVTATISGTTSPQAIFTLYNQTPNFSVPAVYSFVSAPNSITVTQNLTPAIQFNTYSFNLSAPETRQIRVYAPFSGPGVSFNGSNPLISTMPANTASGTYLVLNTLPLPVTANCQAGTSDLMIIIDGTIPGYPYAAINYSPTLYSIVSSALDVNTVAALTGTDNQATLIKQAFPKRLQVKVTDSCGNPLQNKDVTFTITPNGAIGASFGSFNSGITSLTGTTDDRGVATVPQKIYAGSNPGQFQVKASVAGKEFDFTLTNNAS